VAVASRGLWRAVLSSSSAPGGRFCTFLGVFPGPIFVKFFIKANPRPVYRAFGDMTTPTTTTFTPTTTIIYDGGRHCLRIAPAVWVVEGCRLGSVLSIPYHAIEFCRKRPVVLLFPAPTTTTTTTTTTTAHGELEGSVWL
jgi:hypothetical protein